MSHQIFQDGAFVESSKTAIDKILKVPYMITVIASKNKTTRMGFVEDMVTTFTEDAKSSYSSIVLTVSDDGNAFSNEIYEGRQKPRVHNVSSYCKDDTTYNALSFEEKLQTSEWRKVVLDGYLRSGLAWSYLVKEFPLPAAAHFANLGLVGNRMILCVDANSIDDAYDKIEPYMPINDWELHKDEFRESLQYKASVFIE